MILIPIERGHLEQTGNEETRLNFNLLLQCQGSGDEHAQIMPCNKNVNLQKCTVCNRYATIYLCLVIQSFVSYKIFSTRLFIDIN